MPTLLTVRGLVIRETAYGEADKILDLLTENGIRTVRARSARKQGAKYAALTQLFAYGEYCLRQSGERFFLDSAVSLNLYFGLRSDLEALALASYFSELIRRTATDQPQPQLLRLFCYALHHLSEHDRPPMLVKAVFELRLLTELGLMPDMLCCKICGEYLPPRVLFRMEQADFVCADCKEHAEEELPDAVPGTASVLLAVRHVIFSEYDRLFQFRLKNEALPRFAAFTERFLLHQLGGGFHTLKFYHTLTEPGDHAAADLQNDI
ncbi:MAG: DNA repair protein RecO [Oscillospiraceae bacterium]|nr:DNA repair protein RecO [Oscillospiraceae bacterium]